MNKTSFSSCHIPLWIIFVICILIYLTPVQIVHADGAPPPEPDMGGVAPYQPIETNVQMMSETVLIDVLPNPTRWTTSELNWNSNRIRVKASFTLQNQGIQEEKMQVIFPLTRLDYPWLTSSYNIIGSSFVAFVDGKPVPTTGLSTPPELQAIPEGLDSELPDGFFIPDVQWAGFDVTFPVHEDVIVQVEYDMQGDITTGLYHVDYILETGAGWYGRILSADMIVRLPYPASSESVPQRPDGCVFFGNEVRCKMKNIEPKRKDNLTFGFIDTNEWSPALELRSRVEQYPDDAEAWYKLANKYERLGFWYGPSGGASVRDQHLVDLSIEAFEKATDLNHKWGDAHLALARVLWFGKPKLEKLTVEDSVVQRVLLEMQLAASQGITTDNYSYDNVSYEILRAIPDLEQSLLPAPVVLTPPAALPTKTPGPTSDSLQKVVAIAAGSYHTCILTTTGEVKCDGWNLETRTSGEFKTVVAGDFYTCLLTTNGGVKCMGKNNFGQLGDGTTTDRDIPVDVVGLTEGASALAAGDNHTCALMLNGGVKCWGRNYFGQLGDGTTAYSLEPVDVHGLSSGVAALIAGSNHTCILMSSGGVKCWGANEAGQLGDGSTVDRLEPVDIVGLPSAVAALAAGFTHTCALNSQGQVMCWGDNSHGQLGDDDPTVHMTPVIVPGLDGQIAEVAAGNGYTCALTTNGEVECLGLNDFDQLGDGTTEERSTPAVVLGLTSNVVNIAAGNSHNCALMESGRVRCWGMPEYTYRGLEAHYVIESNATPNATSESPSFTPAVRSSAAPAETSSATTNVVWSLALVMAIFVLVLLYQRSKVSGRK
jgi:alpha-tubulin suppressor-like RCC1 family protein